MHIVAIAWLWVVLMMAITQRSVLAGAALFLLLGAAPVALAVALAARRARARREAARSGLEERVDRRDQRDAEPDQ